MSDEYILQPVDDHTDLSDYFYLYCVLCDYFIVLLIMLNIFMSKHLHESMVKSFENNIEIATSIIVIGALLMFCEFVSVSVSIDSSFMFYVRIPTVLFFPLFICLLIYSIKCYSKSERKEIIGACTGCYLYPSVISCSYILLCPPTFSSSFGMCDKRDRHCCVLNYLHFLN